MKSSYDCYIGFAVKKGSVVYGLDNLEVYRKKVFLILCSNKLADNSLQKAQIVADNRNIKLIVISDLEEILKRNCKVLAICDKNLATAIINKIVLQCKVTEE